MIVPTRTIRIERARAISAFAMAYTAVRAAVEHNDVILTLGLHTTSRVAHTPISHVSNGRRKILQAL